MANFFSAIIIILLLLGASFGFYYFSKGNGKPLPSTEVINSTSRSILLSVQDENGNPLVADYVMCTQDKITCSSGTSITQGYTKIDVPLNKSFSVLTKASGYYSDLETYPESYLLLQNMKTIVNLSAHKPLNITISSKLKDNKNIAIGVRETKLFKSLAICIRWSSRILHAQVQNMSETEIPTTLLNKVDKCYSENKDIYNSSMNITVSYEPIGNLGDDYIRVYILDKELVNNDLEIDENFTYEYYQDQSDLGEVNSLFEIK